MTDAGGRGAVILAGGASRRMGMDKAWLEVAPGVALLTRIVETVWTGLDWSPAGGAPPRIVVVGAPGRPLPPLQDGVDRVDDPPDQAGGGPLVGLASGLRALYEGGVATAFVGGTDAPRLSAVHVASVIAALERRGHVADAVVPFVDDADPGRRSQPLASAVRVAPATRLAAHLVDRGERRLQALLPDGLSSRLLTRRSLPDPDALAQANTPSAWRLLTGRDPRRLDG